MCLVHVVSVKEGWVVRYKSRNVSECTPCSSEKFVNPEGNGEQLRQSSDTIRCVVLKALFGCDVEVQLMKSKSAAGGNYSCPAKDSQCQCYGNSQEVGEREQVQEMIRKQQHLVTDCECEIGKDPEQSPG